MSTFEFSVADDVFDAFPDYVVGYAVAEIDVGRTNVDAITEHLRAAEERSRVIFAGKDLKELPEIAAWRRAFSSLGWSASKYPSSVEVLTKRVIKGYELPSIGPAVDLANAVSLTYLVPIGCHDRSTTTHLTVRPASLDDTFLPMGSEDQERPDTGEIIYASGQRVRTRRWVWRQSRDALVQPDATRLFFPVDGFAETTKTSVDAAVHALATLVVNDLGGKVRAGLISADERSIQADVPTD